jgi:hypothetical protein
VTAESLERRRDRAFRRLPALRVGSERAALAFVEDVGVCSTFYRFPEGVACLWEAVVGRENPRWPRRSHHDAGIGLTWELKDTLPAKKRVYYGKLLRARPVLVALDVFPAFYALARGRQRARDYREEYAAGRLSHTARRLMDTLTRERSPRGGARTAARGSAPRRSLARWAGSSRRRRSGPAARWTAGPAASSSTRSVTSREESAWRRR